MMVNSVVKAAPHTQEFAEQLLWRVVAADRQEPGVS